MRINQNVISKCESSLINKAYTFSQNIDIHSLVLHHKKVFWIKLESSLKNK